MTVPPPHASGSAGAGPSGSAGAGPSGSAGADPSGSAGADLSGSAGADLSGSAGADLSGSAGADPSGSDAGLASGAARSHSDSGPASDDGGSSSGSGPAFECPGSHSEPEPDPVSRSAERRPFPGPTSGSLGSHYAPGPASGAVGSTSDPRLACDNHGPHSAAGPAVGCSGSSSAPGPAARPAAWSPDSRPASGSAGSHSDFGLVSGGAGSNSAPGPAFECPGSSSAPGLAARPAAWSPDSRPAAPSTPGPGESRAGTKAPVGGPLPVPSARTAARPGHGVPELPPVSRRFLAKATAVTAALSVAGALLGLVRDQSLARLFGAGSGTDAFLVAWTVPEFASTLLIEDGLAFVLIPAFSLALARRARGVPGDPVRALVAATLPRLTLVFVAASALIVATAPYLVEALAPGLPDPALAVDCTRLTATCVLSFGLAGYCSAALRAHRRFLMPGAIYVAYNAGIITAMFVLGGDWGVRSAAVGVAAGGALMVAVQLPAVWRQLRHSPVRREEPAETPDRTVTLALVAPLLLFALCRQSQVLVERFLASALPPGAISHLNYAQKVAQIPMTLSLMLCTVTFPVVARALADGDTERARTRVERDLALAACMVLLGAATVIACAPQIIELLFQRGAFTALDTAATAGVMRVYALGLLGQTLVGVLIRSYFSAGRPTWYPVCAMAAGILVTSWSGAWAVAPWGVSGIAAANAAGITVTASLLLAGMGTTHRGVPRGIPVRTRQVLAELSRPVCAAAVATPAGGLVASRAGEPLPGLLAGAATVAVVFVLLGLALGAQGFAPALRSVRAAARTFTRRLTHGR